MSTTIPDPGVYRVYPIRNGEIQGGRSTGEMSVRAPSDIIYRFAPEDGDVSAYRITAHAQGWIVSKHNRDIAFVVRHRKLDPPGLARDNPTTYKTPEGKRRTLTPENCPSHLAASMLSEQHWAESQGLKQPKRFGNCTVQSAQYAVANHKPGRGPGGKAFSGEVHRGYYPDADWTVRLHSGVVMSYWKRQLAPGVIRPAAPPVPVDEQHIGRMLPWWPKNVAR